MKHLDVRLRDEQRGFDERKPFSATGILETAVDLYQRLGLIHPFPDANGRVARLAMNHVLRRYCLGYVILPPLSEPGPLWPALQEAHKGRLDSLLDVARAGVCRV
jgi:Fic family protein